MIFKQKTLQKLIQIVKLMENKKKEKDNATSGYRTRLVKIQNMKKAKWLTHSATELPISLL